MPAVSDIVAQRFWAKVLRGPRDHDCWLWIGAVADDGYGRFSVRVDGREKVLRPHRLAWELRTGMLLPVGREPLKHRCDVPLCVRAGNGEDDHAVLSTTKENMEDRAAKGRHANAHTWRWRARGRQAFAAASRELRDALLVHGWDPAVIDPLLTGEVDGQLTLW